MVGTFFIWFYWFQTFEGHIGISNWFGKWCHPNWAQPKPYLSLVSKCETFMIKTLNFWRHLPSVKKGRPQCGNYGTYAFRPITLFLTKITSKQRISWKVDKKLIFGQSEFQVFPHCSIVAHILGCASYVIWRHPDSLNSIGA